MRRPIVPLIAVLMFAAASMPSAQATCGGGGGGGTGGFSPRPTTNGKPPNAYVVPWKMLQAGEQPLSAPIIAYWFPATDEEAKYGDLTTSRTLTLQSQQCVGLQEIRPDDAESIAKWGVAGKLPVVLLVSDGKEVGRVTASKEDGAIRVVDVENVIHDELFRRESELAGRLDEAKKKAGANDRDGAIALYRTVWEQRCIAPAEGREAQKALKRLGIVVKDANLRITDPIMTASMNQRMVRAMTNAFAAELAGNYPRARSLYLAASKIDPADPVPLRFLGEVYRHHTGEWALATSTFEQILAMQPDPLSRAVALHGLGKITIHMGDSAKGLALFEQSIAAYPLALTYRNMAVYWNSEGQRAKADAYVKKALVLSPEEPFNLIFAATYMVDSGRQQEALKIAHDHEDILSASYNLAAIQALLGNKGKAMKLLRRHFYQYERYDAVRAKEMHEARVDAVFVSLRNDPEFVKLTERAD